MLIQLLAKTGASYKKLSMSAKTETTVTYDRSARSLADYFSGIGPRLEDIELAFCLAPTRVDPVVLEIGCGDGRER